MIQLGTEVLHSGIFWTNEFSEARVAEDVFIDLNGAVCVQRNAIASGRTIILEAKGSESGGRSYFTRRQVELIEQWEISGVTLPLVYGTKLLFVSVPAKSLAVTPLRDVAGHVQDDIYYGTVTLLEVGV